MRKLMVLLAAICMISTLAFAQDAGGLDFSAGISLGTDVLLDAEGNTETWNNLGFQPDLALGPFGIGLDLTVHFKLMPEPDTALEVFPGDWLPDWEGSGKSFLDLYLPKFMYVRYGLRGEPLFVKFGSIDDLTLGNGFIVGSYSNTRFLPGQRIFGLDVGLDGTLFDFPFVGVELLAGNLARFDVLGGRLFVRPLVSTSIPILKGMQIGATLAMDTGVANFQSTATYEPVSVYGADIFVPLIESELFPLAAFTEIAFEPLGRSGWMVGAGGRLAGVITYGGQLRLMGAGFSPVYFDANYDLFRADRIALMATEPSGEGFAGWLAKAGASLFEDKLYFDVSVDGAFAPIPAVESENSAEYPHLRGVIGLAEGVLGGFFVSGSYDKYFLGKTTSFFADLVDPVDAVISAAFNYKMGAAVFTLLYNLSYNPESDNGFDVTSSLQSSIKF